jgi:hypothetical protein
MPPDLSHQRRGKIMGGKYGIALGLSLLLLLLSFSASLVAMTTFATLGLALPFWHMAANLWWVLLLIGPVVLLHRANLTLVGAAISVAICTAATLWFSARQQSEILASLPPFTGIQPGAAVPFGPSLFVEINLAEAGDQGQRLCDRLCERLLGGGKVDRVRIVMANADDTVLSRIVYRATPAQCKALDAGFDAAAPCFLVRADDAANEGSPDFRISVTSGPERSFRQEDFGGLAFLAAETRTVFEKTSGSAQRVLHDQTDQTWWKAAGPVPFVPKMDFGTGQKGGLMLTWKKTRADPADIEGIIERAGLPLGPARRWIETRAAIRDVLPAEGYSEHAPHDTAFMRSMLDASSGTPIAAEDRTLTLWMSGFSSAISVPAPARTVLRQMSVSGSGSGTELQRLVAEDASIAIDDLAQAFDLVLSPDQNVSRLALGIIRTEVMTNPPGTHSAMTNAYLQALSRTDRSGWFILFPLVGRFGFDPTPLLQAELDNPHIPSGSANYRPLVQAACNSDPAWRDGLGTLVLTVMQRAIADPHANEFEISRAADTLRILGRKDLLDRFIAETDIVQGQLLGSATPRGC